MFTVEFEGLDELEQSWAGLVRELGDACKASVTEAAEQGAQEARSTHQFKNQSGDLEKSIRGVYVGARPPAPAEGEAAETSPIPSGYEMHWARIRASKVYASFVEDGTKPHVISPIRGTHLTFLWHGEWFSTGTVHHPGSKPHPFMAQAYLKAERVLYADLDARVDRACLALR